MKVINYQKTLAADPQHIAASDRHPANTHFHFSFASYYDPANMNYGALRVLNDDHVKPHSGFGTHPHSEMEIVSYVVDGQLTHRDSTGNHEVLGRGDVQIISAGTGVLHSEQNEQNDWCRFLQIWIPPDTRKLPVRYENHRFISSDRKNKLLPIVTGSNSKNDAPLHINQDINIYVSELTAPKANVTYELCEGRQAYVYCIEGEIEISEVTSLDTRDVLKVSGPASLEFMLTSQTAHFIIIEMAADPEN